MDQHDKEPRDRSAGPDASPRPTVAPDVETPVIALVGFLGAIVIVAILFGLQVVYYRAVAAQFREKDLDRPAVELQKANTAQQARLAQYRWVDQAKGVAAIPIDLAMELVVRERASGAARSSPSTPLHAGGTDHAKP